MAPRHRGRMALLDEPAAVGETRVAPRDAAGFGADDVLHPRMGMLKIGFRKARWGRSQLPTLGEKTVQIRTREVIAVYTDSSDVLERVHME